MHDVLNGNFAPCRWQFWPPQTIRVVNWNIDRGLRLPEITDFLASQQADLLTLQEADLNARRTHYLNVAEELARDLGMNYVFGREFEELTQGSRTSPAYHGQATLSRWRLKNPRVIRFRSQSGFWRPRWFLPHTAPFSGAARCAHCLGNGSRCVRHGLCRLQPSLREPGERRPSPFQLKEVLDDAARYVQPASILLAGDLNFDISEGPTAALVQRTGFRNVIGQSHFHTRPAHSLFRNPRSVDWALVSGPVEAKPGQVHATVNASDHYPISFTLRFS
jgi:endonuclease/exonuclease/phosphatase family metal-dependent hydrolase